MWIDASERLPEELETVLVCTTGGQVTLGARYEGGWETEAPRWDVWHGGTVEVSHWMPLPPPLHEGHDP